jgi:hypothetical protein
LGLNYYFKQSTSTAPKKSTNKNTNSSRVRIGYTLEEGNGVVGVGLQSPAVGVTNRLDVEKWKMHNLNAGVVSNGNSAFTPAIVWVQGDPVI